MEIVFFSFLGKWRVIKEVQTESENDSKTRHAPTEQQLSLGGITGLGKRSLYLNPKSYKFPICSIVAMADEAQTLFFSTLKSLLVAPEREYLTRKCRV